MAVSVIVGGTSNVHLHQRRADGDLISAIRMTRCRDFIPAEIAISAEQRRPSVIATHARLRPESAALNAEDDTDQRGFAVHVRDARHTEAEL
jgi:hypothetical protein